MRRRETPARWRRTRARRPAPNSPRARTPAGVAPPRNTRRRGHGGERAALRASTAYDAHCSNLVELIFGKRRADIAEPRDRPCDPIGERHPGAPAEYPLGARWITREHRQLGGAVRERAKARGGTASDALQHGLHDLA